jgi:ATP-dependent DNA helicase PIF1
VSREYNPEEHNGCIPTKLFALRVKADYINNMMFSKLNEKEYVNEVEISTNTIMYADTTKEIDQETLEKCSKLTKQEIDHEVEHLMNNTPSSKVFRFKKGAVVMCIVNLDMEQSICNGLQVIIIDIVDANGHSPIIEPLPVVKFANGVIKTMTPYIWQSDSYPTISISQFPLCLAWGITIHKIQGTTLSMAEMDIGYSIFEYGQTYVALSRIKSLDGLYLTAFHPQKIKANPKVKAFYDSIESVDMEDINNEELDLSKYVYIEEKVDSIIVKKA